MNEILVAWIWDETNGGSGQSVGRMEIECGIVVSLVYPGPIAKLIICKLAICSLFRRDKWLLYFIVDVLCDVW